MADFPYVKAPDTGCWLWLGGFGDGRGYGRHGSKQAHRAVFEHERGPIPRGFVLDHRCSVKCCVNPDHMDVVTVEENASRGCQDTFARDAGLDWMKQVQAQRTALRALKYDPEKIRVVPIDPEAVTT